MKKKISIKKGNVQETLLLPLWGRAHETTKEKPRLSDEKAVEIIKNINYDFSTIAETQSLSQHGWVARSLHMDKMALDFIKEHPEGTIINIGCGMDTTFSRVDNGKIMFYELDLPDVIELRKHFFKDSKRHKSIASSFLDTGWFEKIKFSHEVLFLAGGVFYYFDEEKIKNFFIAAANYFGKCSFYFDSMSPMGVKIGNKKVLKSGGMGGVSSVGWGLKRAKFLERWDKRFRVKKTTPMHKGIKKGLPLSTKMILSIPDVLGVCSMVHLRVE